VAPRSDRNHGPSRRRAARGDATVRQGVRPVTTWVGAACSDGAAAAGHRHGSSVGARVDAYGNGHSLGCGLVLAMVRHSEHPVPMVRGLLEPSRMCRRRAMLVRIGERLVSVRGVLVRLVLVLVRLVLMRRVLVRLVVMRRVLWLVRRVPVPPAMRVPLVLTRRGVLSVARRLVGLTMVMGPPRVDRPMPMRATVAVRVRFVRSPSSVVMQP